MSALTYAQVLYLLPISLFGMAVAAAELPELSRLGRSGRRRHRATASASGWSASRSTSPSRSSLYVFAGDVIVGALLQRGEFDAADTRLVWYTLAAFSLGLLGTTRSRLLQNGLYALDRPQLVARIAVLRVALAAVDRRAAHVPVRPVRHRRIGTWSGSATSALGPLPDAVAARSRADPRGSGIVGLALGAAASSWVEYRLLRGALEWRIGPIAELGHDTRWSLIAAAGVGVLAAGTPGRHRRPARRWSPWSSWSARAGAMYLGITATMGVDRGAGPRRGLRRLLPG